MLNKSFFDFLRKCRPDEDDTTVQIYLESHQDQLHLHANNCIPHFQEQFRKIAERKKSHSFCIETNPTVQTAVRPELPDLTKEEILDLTKIDQVQHHTILAFKVYWHHPRFYSESKDAYHSHYQIVFELIANVDFGKSRSPSHYTNGKRKDLVPEFHQQVKIHLNGVNTPTIVVPINPYSVNPNNEDLEAIVKFFRNLA